ncbi:endo-1,4-beta-xylanase [Thermocatellispora tengchongensis]|uniref:Beta-xylanase n=1 Tax=Thermocatellispora tengchongensis TaxID=1073253 RepID=A0A840NXH7_9ACTN|nr:endo-1,4-beta-xylanase [Thermocatellispora tengchongensis]MBB5131489.1 endo-1,4-beta-xylanase [Thermocatellispora tengchongensis]
MRPATKRLALGLATLALALAPALPSPASAETAAPQTTAPQTAAHPGKHKPDNLRELARKLGIHIGTAVDVTALAEEDDYRRVLNREFTHITAENAMKWESVEPERGVYNWEGADAVVENARRNHQRVRGHTLVWHNQLPAWLTQGVESGEIDAAELRAILRDHIKKEVGRYRGKIRAWDVANEVIDDDGNMRQSIWLTHLGPGYIADAFRWARQADPHAKLYLNDYNLEWDTDKIDAYLNLVKQLQAQRVPLDGMGFQGHLGIQYDYPGDFPNVMRKFTDLGLEVAITEADARMVLPVTPEKLARQAEFFRDMLKTCAANRRCTEFTVWGFTDRHSWVPEWFEGEGAATPMDENLAPKPAYTAMLGVRRF